MAVRSIVVLLAVVGLVTSIHAVAVGMGDIRLQSTINQPLSAEIDLLSVEGREASQLRASLGTPEDFARAGIDRPFFLTELGFRPELDHPDGPVIRVTSSRPVREPFLDFLVRLEWPDGQLLRAYTVLLDLPDHGFKSAPQTSSVTPSGPSTFDSQPASPATSGAAQALRRPSPPSIPPGTESYAVRAGDTLWGIASRVRPQGMTVQQTLMAVYELNPDAFIDGDMNRLRRDVSLRVPEHSQVAAVDPDQARSALWRESGESAPAPLPIDATGRESEPSPSAGENGQLRLAVPQDNGGAARGTATGDSEAAAGREASDGAARGVSESDGIALGEEVSGRMVHLEEEVLLTRRENRELQERIDNLEEQLQAMARLVELQNDTLAAQPVPEAAADGEAGQAGMMMRNALWLLVGLAVLVLIWALLRRRRQEELLMEETVPPTYVRPADPNFPPMGSDSDEVDGGRSGTGTGTGTGTGAALVGGVAATYAASASQDRGSDTGSDDTTAAMDSSRDTELDLSGDADLWSDDSAESSNLYAAGTASSQASEPEAELDLDMADLDLSALEESEAAGDGPSAAAPGDVESADDAEVSLEDWFAELEQDQVSGAAGLAQESGDQTDSDAPGGVSSADEAALSPDSEADAAFDLDFDEFAGGDDLLSQRDPFQTRLELARVYVDMQDSASAREILEELVEVGSPEQQREARELLDSLS